MTVGGAFADTSEVFVPIGRIRGTLALFNTNGWTERSGVRVVTGGWTTAGATEIPESTRFCTKVFRGGFAIQLVRAILAVRFTVAEISGRYTQLSVSAHGLPVFADKGTVSTVLRTGFAIFRIVAEVVAAALCRASLNGLAKAAGPQVFNAFLTFRAVRIGFAPDFTIQLIGAVIAIHYDIAFPIGRNAFTASALEFFVCACRGGRLAVSSVIIPFSTVERGVADAVCQP